MVVTFFGHRDAPASVESPLTETLVDLIENKGATRYTAIAEKRGKPIINIAN